MTSLLPIGSISRERVESQIRQMLRTGLDVDAFRDFLASIDWSGANRSLPEVGDLIGQLEEWTERYSENNFTREEYVTRLVQTLPAGGFVDITFSALPRRTYEQDQSAPLLQTGSNVPPTQETIAPGSDNVRELAAIY